MNLHATSFTLQHYLINIIGNKRHSNIISIMEETECNIYLPSPWTKMTQPSDIITEFESTIHVTGNTIEAVQRATLLLKKLIPQKVFIKKKTCHYICISMIK